MNYATAEEALAAICTHRCRFYPGLRLNPHHCELRGCQRSNPMVSMARRPFWECHECEGPVPEGVSSPPKSKKIFVSESKPTDEKTCNKCGRTLPATTEYFYPHYKTKSGLCGDCKECRKTRTQEYEKMKTLNSKSIAASVKVKKHVSRTGAQSAIHV